MFRSGSPLTLDLKHKTAPRSASPTGPSPGRHSGTPAYQDVRLHSTHKNVILVKGSPNESDPVAISGQVVFSLLATTCVSSISLNLRGTYNVHFVENFQASNGKVIATCPFLDSVDVLNCTWDNLLTSSQGRIVNSRAVPATPAVSASKTSSSSATPTSSKGLSILPRNFRSSQLLHNFSSCRTIRYNTDIRLGTTPFAGVDTENTVFELPPGNYSFPFHITLPGSIPETVESMKSVSIVYRFESKINALDPAKTAGSSDDGTTFTAHKYVRVIRTLSSLQLALNEDFLAENSWACKLQYKIRIPRKLVPVGSMLKIYLLIIPIMKQLKLGKITVQIAQYLKFHSSKPNEFGEKTFTDEKIVYQKSLPVVPHSHLPQDVWALEARLPTSDMLKNCSPDVETASHLISVKHKLIIFINLVNPDGHISQIKSKIPFGFYIKPNSRIYGKNVEINKDTGTVAFANGKSLVFDVDSDNNNISTGEDGDIPELIVSMCDELNPDSFLFKDNPNADEIDAAIADTPSPSPALMIPQLSENPNNCSTRCEVPPSYTESANDAVFEPNMWSEGTSPIPGTPRLETPTLEDFFPSSGSSSRLFKIAEDVPCYRKVYDDDASSIGEPAPLYSESHSHASATLRPRASSSSSSVLRSSMEKRHMKTVSASLPSSRPVSPLVSVSSTAFSLRRPPSNTLLNSNTTSSRNNNSSSGDNPPPGWLDACDVAARDSYNEDNSPSSNDGSKDSGENPIVSRHQTPRGQMDRSGLTSCFSSGMLSSSSSSELDLIGV